MSGQRSAASRKTAASGCSSPRLTLRPGGRIEVVEGLGSSGMFARPTVRPDGYDSAKELEAAGFRPVRVLAELANFRFVEGLRQ